MTRDRLYTDIAQALNTTPEELDPHTSLTDQGLDSITLVTVVENWRADGIDVDFFRMTELATLAEWEQELIS